MRSCRAAFWRTEIPNWNDTCSPGEAPAVYSLLFIVGIRHRQRTVLPGRGVPRGVRGLRSESGLGVLSTGDGSLQGLNTGKDTIVVNSILTGCHEKVLCVPASYSGLIRKTPWKQILNHYKKGPFKWSETSENINDGFRRWDPLGHKVYLGKRLEDL